MKKIIVSLLCIGLMTAFTKDQSETALIKTWKLKSHTMSGVGKHAKLPDNMTLEFMNGGTWKTSSPWEGVTQGKWNLKQDKQQLHVSFAADSEKDFKVTSLSGNQLQFENSTKLAVYKFSWEAVK